MKKAIIFILLAVLAVSCVSGCAAVIPAGGRTAAPGGETSPDPTVSPTQPGISHTAAPTAQNSVAPAAGPATVAEKVLNYSNEYIAVNIVYPEVAGLVDSGQQQNANNELYMTLKQGAEQAETDSKNQEVIQQYTYDAVFTVYRNDGRFLSIREDIQYWSGGAGLNVSSVFLNYMNTTPGQTLSLATLFTPGADYEGRINSGINSIIAADPSSAGDYWFSGVTGGTGYYLTDSEIVIVFDKYAIAPGAMGEPEFSIPYSDLSDILIPQLR